MSKHASLTTTTLLILASFGCVKPDEDVGKPDEAPGAEDDVGELPPPVNPLVPEPLPTGQCVTSEIPPYFGIRHQCGGSIDLQLTGAALGYDVDQTIFVPFGEGVEGDSYEFPRVANCCAPYEYDLPNSSNPEHWRTCLYDAVQQVCAAVPYYLWDMGENAHAAGQLSIGNAIIKLGNDLATSAKQNECLTELWGTGPGPDDVSRLFDHQWKLGYDIWLNIDVLEILEVTLPEDEADWLECRSVFENDDTIMPNIPQGPIWDNLQLAAGALKAEGDDLELKAVPDSGSEILLGWDTTGSPILGALQLHGSDLRIDGFSVVDRWRLSTLRATVGEEGADGTLHFAPHTVTFIAAAVVDDDVVTVPVSNGQELVLVPSKGGWVLDPFTLVYTQATGDVWTLHSSPLTFSGR